MKTLASITFSTLFFSTVFLPAVRASNDVSQIIKQFHEVVLTENPAGKAVADLLAKMRPDGSWPDINYASKRDMQWDTAEHVSRIQNLTVAYRTPGNPCFQKPATADAIHRALAYWREAHPVSPNWWWNEIGVPMKLGTAMVLLEGHLTPEELAQCKDLLNRKTINRAGQNGVWAAGVDILFALPLNDEATIQKSVKTIFGHVAVPLKEGLQTDISFQQHGPHQQFGNYGIGFATDTVRWMEILHGTQYQSAMTPEKLAIFSRFMRDGMAQVLWKGNMDIIGLGRHIYPDHPLIKPPTGGNGPRDKAATVVNLFQRMIALDPAHAEEYRKLVAFNQGSAANPLVGNKLFFRSDQMVHRRPEFSISIKGCSTRTTATECSGTENLLGHYLGDGTTFLYRSGLEYSDIFPVWDWRKVPGVTCAQSGPLPNKNAHYKGTTEFVGGVSDGSSGCFAMDLNRGGITARKAWFLSGDTIVCLGAGITSTSEAPVATTVNQCLLNGPVTFSTRTGTQAELPPGGSLTPPQLQTLTHDGISYLFPQDAKITISSEHRKRPWAPVTEYGPSSEMPIEKDVLTVGFDHGAKPTDASYSYVILPAIGQAGTAAPKTLAAAGVTILKNTGDCQAVFFQDAKLLQAIFHKEGSVQMPAGTSLAVDSPCAVLVNTVKTPPEVWVADPTEKLGKAAVTLNGQKAEAALPQGSDSGRPVCLRH